MSEEKKNLETKKEQKKEKDIEVSEAVVLVPEKDTKKQEVTIVDKKEIIPTQTQHLPSAQVANFTLSSLNSPEKLLGFADMLVKGDMCSFKKPADAVIGLITGQELGIGLAAVLGGVYVIEGRPSLGVHVKKAILLNNGVVFKKTRDMEAYYRFVDYNKEHAALHKKRQESLPEDKRKKYGGKLLGFGYLNDLEKYTKLAVDECRKAQIDTRTEYVFTRHFRTIRGVVTNTAVGMYSISEANQAGLMEKGTWKKYTRDLLSSRAFSRGSNEIADDLLNGMLSFSELADINDGVTYLIDENGHEQIVQ